MLSNLLALLFLLKLVKKSLLFAPKKEDSSCSACGHQLQDLTHLLLDCPVSELLRYAIFGSTSSIFDSGPHLVQWPDIRVSVAGL